MRILRLMPGSFLPLLLLMPAIPYPDAALSPFVGVMLFAGSLKGEIGRERRDGKRAV